MDKGRAIITYVMAKMRERAGEAELLDCPRHIFWEACRLLEKNGWEKEAREYLINEVEDKKARLLPIKKEYLEYLKSEEKDEIKERRFKYLFQEFNINGEEEEEVKFEAKNNRKPNYEELSSILKHRKEEDYRTLTIFVEEQAKLYLGEEFSQDLLVEASKKLKDHGLYKIALKNIPVAIRNLESFKEDESGHRQSEYRMY